MKDYKLLSEKIYERMSVRKYADIPVAVLDDGKDVIQKFGIVPLFKDIRCKIVLLKDGEVKNNRSKYCFGFYSDEAGGYLENVGFMGEQLALELQALGVGTCFWGMKRPIGEAYALDGMRCVITMSAGYPEGAGKRTIAEFERKPLTAISLKESDEYIEAVRLAPSAINNQPWLVEKKGNSYNFYMSKPSFFGKLFMGNMRKIDMGIGISHLFVKAKADGFDVDIKADGQNLPDAAYIATLTLK
ncbi:MAG: hypothetical protein LBP62_07395 [Clostridiales bacterium]|nr:hypothetical protein [Clostridiales bacterium]